MRPCVSMIVRVDDAVTAGKRLALPGHRLDEQRHVRGLVGMLVRHHHCGRGLHLPRA
jgi:hypothetical protein